MNNIVKCSNRACGLITDIANWRHVPTANPRVTEQHCPRCDGMTCFGAKPGEVERPKTGAQLIALERNRQLKIEGWTPAHDDTHKGCEMARAASAYAIVGSQIANLHLRGEKPVVEDEPYLAATPMNWPWQKEWWKPSSDPIRNLIKSGALLAAEIDRLQRLGNAGQNAPDVHSPAKKS